LPSKRRRSDDRVDGEIVKVKLKLYDKKSALIDLGKHLGLFKDDQGSNLTFIQVVKQALATPLDQIPPPPWLKDITPPRKKGEE
jgi:hypothetical protein